MLKQISKMQKPSLIFLLCLAYCGVLQSNCGQKNWNKSPFYRGLRNRRDATGRTTQTIPQVSGVLLSADSFGLHEEPSVSHLKKAFSDLQTVEETMVPHVGTFDNTRILRDASLDNLEETIKSQDVDGLVSHNQAKSFNRMSQHAPTTLATLTQIVTSTHEVGVSPTVASDDAPSEPNEVFDELFTEKESFDQNDINEAQRQTSLKFASELNQITEGRPQTNEGGSDEDTTHSVDQMTDTNRDDCGYGNTESDKWEINPSKSEADDFQRPHSYYGYDTESAVESRILSGERMYFPPKDYFKCDRCKCHKLANNNMYADCGVEETGRVVRTFPKNLPENTAYLTLIRNFIYFFGFDSFAKYPFLSTLLLSYNRIEILKNETCTQPLSIRVLDLSYNKISVVQDNFFSCLPHLKSLDLKYNKIEHLSTLMFAGPHSLQQLDLSHNQIQAMDEDTFDDCNNLLTLSLSRNEHLTYDTKTLGPRLFRPLRNLKELYIEGFRVAKSKSSSPYPISALVELVNLETLFVDGVRNGHFEDNLTALRNLTTVNIGSAHQCFIGDLHKSYFEGLPYLTTVQISDCKFQKVSPQAFDSNKLLADLSYSHISYSFDSMFESLSGLQDKPIKSLTLSRIYESRQGSPCRVLLADHAYYIKNLTHLKSLNLDNNQIAYIDDRFLSSLPEKLKQLSLSENALSYAQSVLPRYKIHRLYSLEVLNEDLQNHGNVFNSYYYQEADFESCKSLKREIHHVTTPPDYTKGLATGEPLNHAYNILPHIKVYSAVQSFNFGRQLLSPRLKKNDVTLFNISNSFITNWGSRTFSTWIEVADVSNNFCDALLFSFVKRNNSLKELHARGNILGPDLSNDFSGDKLSRLSDLEFIDFSLNHVNVLPPAVFISLESIKVIDLSNNNIKSFNVTMSHMTSLVFLNLKKNSITWISRETRNDMDALPNVTIDLTSNPLPCTCEGLELLIWLATTRVKLISQDYLQCEDKNKNTRYIGDLRLAVATLQRQCASKAFLVLAASFSAVAFLLIASAVWIFRNRWWLYYMKNIMITKMFGYKTEDGYQAQQYWYDAYIHYGKQDAGFVMGECLQELEVKRGHKLCVEHRDFVLGSIMPCTITSAISRSHLTVPVITPEFWSGEWSEYGVQMAMMESIHTKRDVLHLLIYRPVDLEDMPRNLLKIHNDNAFSEYPPEDCREDVKKAFWDAMSRSIGHIKPTVALEERDE